MPISFLKKKKNITTTPPLPQQNQQGVRLTKDLVGAPANFVTPRYLAETAKQIAKAGFGLI